MNLSPKWAGVVAGLIASTAIAQDIQHGYIDAEEIDCANNPTSVNWTRVGGSGSWSILGGNRGDIDTDFVVADGILITCPAEVIRYSDCIGGGKGPYYVTTNSAVGSNGFYFIPMHESPGGGEANYDVACAYFPVSTWTGAVGYVSTNGGPITEFLTSPGIELRTPETATGTGSEFIDNGNGLFDVRLDGIDAQRDGVVLSVSAKNEDNYSNIFMRADGTFIIVNKDNGDNGGGSEQDPAGFVFIPQNTEGIVMGRIAGSGATVFGQGDFTLTREDVGAWRLAIDGQTPETGTLIVSACGLESNNIDNPVWMQPDGDTWVINSRDITGMGRQDLFPSEGFFHFAFLPNDIAGVVPGTPDQAYLDQLDDVVAGRYLVTELSAGNGLGETTTAPGATASDALLALGENRGDQAFVWLNAMVDGSQGILMPSISQGFRDNSATGGTSGYGVATASGGEVRTFALLDSANAKTYVNEQNVDYSVVYFPFASGYAADVVAIETDVLFIDAGSSQDGVLMTTAWENTGIVTTATPSANGFDVSGWRTQRSDGSYEVGDIVPSMGVAYAYLPFATPGLEAGAVSAMGTLTRGTAGVTVTREGDSYRIASDDFDAATEGVMLLTPESPAAMHWTVDGSDFIVTAIDLGSATPTEVAFSFAIVPADGLQGPVEAGCLGDINGDGFVDGADFGSMLGAWGPIAGSTADLNGDGEVNGTDLGLLLGAWGECPGDPCEDVNCDDGDPCTTDFCVDGDCFHEPIDGCNGVCGDPADNACNVPGDAGCADADCCNAVCALDSFCCDVEWDAACVSLAAANCD